MKAWIIFLFLIFIIQITVAQLLPPPYPIPINYTPTRPDVIPDIITEKPVQEKICISKSVITYAGIAIAIIFVIVAILILRKLLWI